MVFKRNKIYQMTIKRKNGSKGKTRNKIEENRNYKCRLKTQPTTKMNPKPLVKKARQQSPKNKKKNKNNKNNINKKGLASKSLKAKYAVAVLSTAMTRMIIMLNKIVNARKKN